MKDKLFVLGKIISLVIFLFVLSLMGLVTKQPVMMLVYAGFFAVVMFIIFIFVKMHQRHFEIIKQESKTLSKIIGAFMILVAVALPVLAMSNMQLFDMGTKGVTVKLLAFVLAINLSVIIAGVVGVWLINSHNSNLVKKILGYLIVILASAIPGVLVMPYDKTSIGIGSVYWLMIMVAVIAWWGFSLFLNKE